MLARVRAVSAAALSSGALQPIETVSTTAPGLGVDFVIRRASALRRKDASSAAPARGPARNPFLPPEPALRVCDVAPRHIAVLNKFRVVDAHVLVVTAAFEPQGALLSAADFSAIWHAVTALDGLAFYNAGRAAGASQPHKHAQVVPRASLPAADALARAALPFLSAAAPVPRASAADNTGEALAALYHELLRRADPRGRPDYTPPADDDAALTDVPPASRQPYAYNLLLTADWMLLVPRAREHHAAISVNALAFAGSLFVRDDAALRAAARDPAAVLRGVTFPAQ